MTELQKIATELFESIRAATADGPGVTRESFGPGEESALQILEQHAKALDLACERDPLQNLWIRRTDETDAEQPCVIIGSHADSVPVGGNFDGLAGIVSGILILHELQRTQTRTARPVRVLAMRGEESAWYGKAYIGSLALLGKLDARTLQSINRDGSRTLGQAMTQAGADIRLIENGQALLQPSTIAAYLELHIEQGPVMVAREWPVAAVTGIRGNIRHQRIRCIGEAGHSGAVPRWLRKDAMLAVAELLSRLDERWRVLLQMGMDLVMTAGICQTDPKTHAVSVIPGEVSFSLEVRSQSNSTLTQFHALIREECDAIERSRGVRFVFDAPIETDPAEMSPDWISQLSEAAETLNIKLETLPSGAGHDSAVFANAGVPSAMVFIRNEHGSHNSHEAMDMQDFLLGTRLLMETVKSFKSTQLEIA